MALLQGCGAHRRWRGNARQALSVSLRIGAIGNRVIQVRAMLTFLGWTALLLGAGSSAFGASTLEPKAVDFERKAGAAYPSAPHDADIEPFPGRHFRGNVADYPLSPSGNAFIGLLAADDPGGLLNPVLYAAPGAMGVSLGDLDGDGNDDVLLRHADGRWLYYPMDGRRHLRAGQGSAQLTSNLDWRLAGIGDLNGDGNDDVLLRHTDGRWYYYPMDGRRHLAGRGSAQLTSDLNWRFAGIGDLNGDGNDDVLLRHTDGRWYYYPMNGRRHLSGRGPARITSNRDWSFAGIGDLNGDGNDDVLLRHTDGQWYYYPMNGRLHVSGRGSARITSDLNWRFAGIGDLNGDGNDDVLLRHRDGRWYHYPMDGRLHLSGRGSARIISDLNWHFAGIGDLNGDRMDDVLLRHADGRWYYYPMDGRLHLQARGASDVISNLDWYLPTLFRSVPGFQGPQQTYLQTSEIPHDLIEREWDRGLFITSISRSDDYWNVLMSRSVGGIDAQSIHVSSSFPRDGIDAAWGSGQRITEVAYGDGRWVVVASSGTNFGVQGWFLRGDLPTEAIREARGEGRLITALAYGDGLWAGVTSEVRHYAEQVYATEELGEFMETHWEQGYRATESAYGDGTWVIFMTRTGHEWPQRWRFERIGGLPIHEIHTAWDRGLDVLDITYGNGWYWSLSSGGLSNVMGFSPPVLPSGGTLRSEVKSWSANAAEFEIDLFAVDSNSELLQLDPQDIRIDSLEWDSGRLCEFSQDDVTVVNQAYIGPYSATFLFDQSGSITSTDPSDSRIDAARVFLRNLGAGDEVGLLAFASGGLLPHSPVTTYSDPNGNAFTNDPNGFDGALRELANQERGGTPLYDAVVTAVRYTVDRANNSNRVVIVFTDGENNSSTASLDDAIATANQNSVPLHTIALSAGVDLGVLSQMADRTGGALARASDAKRLISYYGALGPFLSGSATFYRTTWKMSCTGANQPLGKGHWITSCVRVSAPGGTICVPFRLDFN